MDYPKRQIDEVKAYCRKLAVMQEGGVTFFSLEGLRLPTGCEPQIFHIHMHGCVGETGMSRTDARELAPMIPGFRPSAASPLTAS